MALVGLEHGRNTMAGLCCLVKGSDNALGVDGILLGLVENENT